MSNNFIFRMERAVRCFFAGFAASPSPLDFTLLPFDCYKMINKICATCATFSLFLLYIFTSIAYD